jgi:hypothetical protein
MPNEGSIGIVDGIIVYRCTNRDPRRSQVPRVEVPLHELLVRLLPRTDHLPAHR